MFELLFGNFRWWKLYCRTRPDAEPIPIYPMNAFGCTQDCEIARLINFRRNHKHTHMWIMSCATEILKKFFRFAYSFTPSFAFNETISICSWHCNTLSNSSMRHGRIWQYQIISVCIFLDIHFLTRDSVRSPCLQRLRSVGHGCHLNIQEHRGNGEHFRWIHQRSRLRGVPCNDDRFQLWRRTSKSNCFSSRSDSWRPGRFLSQQLPLDSLGASEHLPPGPVPEPATPSTNPLLNKAEIWTMSYMKGLVGICWTHGDFCPRDPWSIASNVWPTRRACSGSCRRSTRYQRQQIHLYNESSTGIHDQTNEQL